MTAGAVGCSAAGVLRSGRWGWRRCSLLLLLQRLDTVLQILDRLQRLIEQALELFVGLRLRAAIKTERERKQ